MPFKVDFEKAYNFVDWSYLDSTLKMIKFTFKWNTWMFEYLRSSTTLTLVNSCPTDEYLMVCGLRQSVYLLHFIFLIIAKMFNLLFYQTIRLKRFFRFQVEMVKLLKLLFLSLHMIH